MNLVPIDLTSRRQSTASESRETAGKGGLEHSRDWSDSLGEILIRRGVSPVSVAARRAEELIAKGKRRAALDVALRAVDRALKQGNFRTLREFFAQHDWEQGTIDVSVTLLMAAKPARKAIPERRTAVARLLRRLLREAPERHSKIAPFL